MKSNIEKLTEFDKSQGVVIIGTDEAGRGSAVGAVFASAVYFNNLDKSLINSLSKLNDSKQISAKVREELYSVIKNNTVNSTISIDAEEIERDNILNASLHAMRLAVNNVAKRINNNDNILVLVDGCQLIKGLSFNQKYIIKGDSQSASIAAASILAKVERDNYIIKLSKQYPEYFWQNNMGYLTNEHIDAIDRFGLTPYHRKSFLEKHFAKQNQLKLF